MRKLPLESWHLSRGAALAASLPGSPDEPAGYGDDAAEARAVREAAGLFDASARERLLATGPDRVPLLDSLTTNDLKSRAPGSVLDTAFITARGRLVADARATVLDDALLLDVEAGRAEPLREDVSRHQVREEAALADVSEALAALELWGPRAAQAAGAADLPEGASRALEAGGAQVVAARTPFGLVLYVPTALAAAVADDLLVRVERAGGRLVGRRAVDLSRVELGLGRFGLDWDEKTHPLEAGLDRAISYKKGCYVGQEVVAKATYVGRVSRRLVRLAWEGAPAPAGTPLVGARVAGRVTSSAAVPGSGRVLALGYVRHDAAAAGTKHRVGEGGPEAVVLGWPFGSRDTPV